MTPFEQELAGHAQALRALARLLVGDQHADDLVQETSLHVLRRQPQQHVHPRAWWLAVLRHRAQKLRRGEQRRAARERAHAEQSGDPAPEPRQLAEHKETAQRLHRALMALPEPYQATLWQRFFQDLTPSAIAAHTGIPVATVKSRLQRGLDLLRADFAGNRDEAQWRAALAAAFALDTGAALAAATTGALFMGTTVKLALAAGVAVAVGLFAFGSPDAPAAPPSAGAHTDVAAATGRAPETPLVAEPTLRTDAARDVHAAPSEPTPVCLRLVDAADREPLPQFAVRIVGLGERDATLVSDANGELWLPGRMHGRDVELRLIDDVEDPQHAEPAKRLAAGDWPARDATWEIALPAGPTFQLVFADGAPPEAPLLAMLTRDGDFARMADPHYGPLRAGQRVRAGAPPWVRCDPATVNPSSLGAGPWMLSVYTDTGLWLAQGAVDTVRGRHRSPVVLRTVDCGSIEVKVTVDGEPIGKADERRGFHASIYRLLDDGSPTGRDVTLQLGVGKGPGRADLLRAGRYRVYVGTQEEAVRTHDVEVRPGETALIAEDYRARTDLLSLHVVVRSQSGDRDLDFVSVYARRPDGTGLRSGLAGEAPKAGQTAPPTFTDLTAGEWDIEISPTPHLPPWDAMVKRVDAAARTIEFVCLDLGAPPPGYARVHVIDAAGKPLSGAGVTTFVDGRQHYWSTADAEGNTIFGPYLSGRALQVLVCAVDCRPTLVDVVPAVELPPPQRVQLSPGWGTMLVAVQPGSSIAGTPLADVEVLLDGAHRATTDAKGLALLSIGAPPTRIELRRNGYELDYGSIDPRTGSYDGGTLTPFFVVMKPVR